MKGYKNLNFIMKTYLGKNRRENKTQYLLQ